MEAAPITQIYDKLFFILSAKNRVGNPVTYFIRTLMDIYV